MKTNRVCFRWSSSFSLFFALLPLLTTSSLSAATNDLTSLLQRGLFEEEANRNPAAAIASYQSLAAEFDKDRAIAATAVFRLGECYRKLGRTNDAVAQYERIVREFTDQPTLVTLSRQNLAGLGAQAATPSPNAEILTSPEAEELARTRRILAQLGGWDLSQLRRLIPSLVPDSEFERLERDLVSAENSKNPVDVSANETFKDSIRRRMEDRASIIIETLERRALQLEEKVAKQTSGRPPPTAPGNASGVTTDEEQQEIRRIQAMIQNSPDLINAPDASGDTPLMRAAAKGQMVVARYLLDHGAGANVRGQNAGPPISHAVRNGHKAMVELLIAHGADLNAKAEDRTPLTDAISRKFTGVVEALLTNNADVNQPSTAGMTPLHAAAIQNNAAFTKLLIARKANVDAKDNTGETPLMKALSNPGNEIPSILIAAGADTRATNNNGRTALHLAAWAGRTNLILPLLAAGADVGAKDNHGTTPLYLAGSRRFDSAIQEQLYFDAASVLLKHGAPADAATLQGATPLLQSVANGNVRFVKLLLDHKADPNRYGSATMSSGGSSTTTAGYPVAFALATKNNDALKLLLEHGANPEEPARPEREPGERPLTVAIRTKQAEAVQLLLRFKADPNRADSRVLPLEQAIGLGSDDIVRLLLEAKANPNALTQSGEPLLNQALRMTTGGSIPTLLLTYGADVNVRDANGNVPLHHAVSLAKKGAVSLLISSNANVNAQNQRGLSPLDVAMSALTNGTIIQILANPGDNHMTTVDKSSMQEIVTLLREHGARTDLPRFDRIEVRRPSANASEISFQKDTDDWNQFSLLEVIARTYGQIKTSRAGGGSHSLPGPPLLAFRFPDFKRVIIHRPTADGKNWKSIPVDVAAILETGDCSRDVWLQWGDVVEIPEADHTMSDNWNGLNAKEYDALVKCVSRSVKIVVQGVSTEFQPEPRYKPSFMLRSVLDSSRLIRFSSDLSRVKVTRPVPAKGKPREWILNCTDPDSSPDFWLRNGDVVEIPEK